MKNKIIYNITILNWEKYNKKSTKNMPSIMLSKRFFDDAKIISLPPSGKLLYLFLLLRRGDHDTNSFECSHDHCVTYAGGRGVLVSTLLDQLQSLQLLTYEKTSLNRIEYNIKEKEENIIVPTCKSKVETSLPVHSKAISRPVSKTLIKITQPKELADLLDQKNKNLLFELYGDPEFIKREFYKIQNWLDANPKKNNKTDRGWLQFVANWLDNAWPKYQKNIPSNQAKASSVDELMSMMGWS